MASGSPPRRYGGARLHAFGMVLRRAGVTLLFVIAIFVGALSGIFLAYEKDLPQVSSLEDFEPNIITQVYTGDGKLLGEFAIERRVVVGFKDIPPVLRNATIAVEDADFWKHLGVNPWRIPGALLANLRSGKRTQGSSTLTMQLVRQPGLFLTPEKTYERKIKEALLAFELEKTFTKEEIFTYYCNQVYFGHGNYGVEAASEFLFSKSIKDLTLPEAALLAGLPQSPSRLSPVEHADRALQRRNHVLQRMLEEKYISVEEATAAQAEPLHLNLKREPPSIAPYFLEEVRKYLEKEYGSQRIYQGGLRVYTTLDSATQIAANRSVRDWLRVMDRRSRGFVPPTESVLKDGKFPDRLHLEDWEGPIAAGDVVRGVVLASERGIALVRLGEYVARVGPVELAWTRRTIVAEVLRPGTIAPFLFDELPVFFLK
jgi:penicillin-binding protein 1A